MLTSISIDHTLPSCLLLILLLICCCLLFVCCLLSRNKEWLIMKTFPLRCEGELGMGMDLM